MRILVVDNNILPDFWGSDELRHWASRAPGATVVTRRGPHADLPKSPAGFDRIIVSGSLTSANEDADWIGEMLEFIRNSIDRNIPFLGVCFGHQMLARALGSKDSVRKAKEGEFGWTKIETVAPSALYEGLPSTFYSYSHHYDEVCQLPPGAKKTAVSELCAVQSFELEGKPVYGIQFHPERGLEEAKASLKDELKNNKKSEKKLLFPKDSDRLYNPLVAEKIFGNFLRP